MAEESIISTLYEVEAKLKACRTVLDNKMYGGEGMNESSYEFKKLRKIYDAICRVMDMM